MGLGEYLIVAVALSAVMGVIGALSHTALASECETGIGIICLATVLTPIVGIVASSDVPTLPDYTVEAGLEGDYAEVGEGALLLAITGYLSDKYSLSAEEVCVTGEGYSFTEARFSRLTVRLAGNSALADVRGMRDEIGKLFLSDGGECRVVIDFDQ